MKSVLKIICSAVLVLLPFIAHAADVNFQLQVNPPATNTGSSGGGGASGGPSTPPPTATSVTLAGRTSPNAFVEVVIGNQVMATAIAAADGSFSINIPTNGTQTILLRSTDVLGNTTQLNQPLTIAPGTTGSISGLILPPTLAFAAATFKQGELITGTGRTVPGGTVSVVLTDAKGGTSTQLLTAEANGVFNVSFNSKALPLGPLSVQVADSFGGASASATYVLTIVAPGKTPPPVPPPIGCTAQTTSLEDFNCDGKVSLIDLSMMLSHYGEKNPPKQFDLNHDNKINLIDFSILLFYLNKPIIAAFVDAPMLTESGDVTPPTVVLDVGPLPDGKLVAAFAATDSQSDVKQVEISLDNGKHWRPAESPYLLGLAQANAVELRATDAVGNTRIVSSVPSRHRFSLLIAAVAGALVAAAFIALNFLTLKKHE